MAKTYGTRGFRGREPVGAFSATKSGETRRNSTSVAERHGRTIQTCTVLTEGERRAKVLEILNSLDAYAPPRVGDLDLSEPGRGSDQRRAGSGG